MLAQISKASEILTGGTTTPAVTEEVKTEDQVQKGSDVNERYISNWNNIDKAKDLGSSTFLIDLSRKCQIGGVNTAEYSLRGDLSDNCLKNLGFSFKENFTAGNETLEKIFAKITAPVTKLLGVVAAKIPLIGEGVSDDLTGGAGTDQFTNNLITLYSLLASFSNNDISEATNQLQNLQGFYKYNIPLRKAPPSIGLQSGGITIEFAYGKCNWFDAYFEVWLPLQKLKNVLFPSFKESENVTGFIHIKGSDNIPFPQQALPVLLSHLWQTGKSEAASIYSGFSTGGFKELKEVTKELGESSETGKERARSDWNSIQSNPTKNSLQSFVKKFTGTGDNAIPGASDVAASINSITSRDLKKYKEGKDESLMESIDAKFRQVSDMIDTLPDDVKYVNGTYIKGVATKALQEGAKGLQGILKNMIMLKPSVVGGASNELGEKALKGTCYIAYGFTQRYFTRFSDLYDFVCGSERVKESTPRIQLTGMIPEKVSINFDFSQVDAAGWPMKGTLKIESVWNIYNGGRGVTLG